VSRYRTLSKRIDSELRERSAKGSLFIVSAPAGTGKTTLVDMLLKEFSSAIASISFTTRKPRAGEIEGKHYHFLSPEEFEKRIAEDEFLEYVTLYGDYYGTSTEWVKSYLNAGTDVILVIDTQGARLLRSRCTASLPSRLVTLFIAPPSLLELEKRLRGRATDAEEKIEQRLKCAQVEIEEMKFYDYGIVNDDLNAAYDALRSIYIAEKHRIF